MTTAPKKIVTAAEMQAIDRQATEVYGMPALLLMENAGRGIAELAARNVKGKNIVLFCGKGNNGGDGLVAARHLFNRGFRVTVVLLCEPSSLKGDAALNFNIASKMKIPIKTAANENERERFPAYAVGADLIVDAIFGIGLNSAITGIFETAVRAINESGRTVLAADIPSGLDADEGTIHGIAVKAAVTATLGLPKQGLFKGEGPRYAGKVAVLDIGLPAQLLA